MKDRWKQVLSNTGDEGEDRSLFQRMGGKVQTSYDAPEGAVERETASQVDHQPIEPDAGTSRRPSVWKWIFFALVVLYGLLSYYHAPLLTRMGRYLVVEHSPESADVIVCMMGENVGRGLAAADIYQKGLAPKVFVAREEIPDGMAALEKRGVEYPEPRDLLIDLLTELGVPREACLSADPFVVSTFEEVQAVRDVAQAKGFQSFIVVTSPIHTRRTYMTFRKVFEEEDVEIMMVPTGYSGFEAETWWKTHEYVQAVVVEYQKLVYYALKYFW
jgi:uncharacterized SAM-binding protein YcdF (DUF218 family)